MKTINTMNDLNSLYDKPHWEHKDGTFECPVCNKKMKTEKGMKNHMDARDCADLKSLLKGTTTEMTAFRAYAYMQHDFFSKESKFSSFGSSPAYKPYLRYVLFANYHEISDYVQSYLAWAQMLKKFKHQSQIVSFCLRRENLNKFIACINKYGLIESGPFMTKFLNNIDDYDNPQLELIRGLEKGEMSVYDIAKEKRILDLLQYMDSDHKHRLNTLFNEAENYQHV